MKIPTLKGLNCPTCGSTRALLNGWTDATKKTRRYRCGDCGKSWTPAPPKPPNPSCPQCQGETNKNGVRRRKTFPDLQIYSCTCCGYKFEEVLTRF